MKLFQRYRILIGNKLRRLKARMILRLEAKSLPASEEAVSYLEGTDFSYNRTKKVYKNHIQKREEK